MSGSQCWSLWPLSCVHCCSCCLVGMWFGNSSCPSSSSYASWWVRQALLRRKPRRLKPRASGPPPLLHAVGPRLPAKGLCCQRAPHRPPVLYRTTFSSCGSSNVQLFPLTEDLNGDEIIWPVTLHYPRLSRRSTIQPCCPQDTIKLTRQSC